MVDWGGLIMLENHFKSVLFLFEKKKQIERQTQRETDQVNFDSTC